MLLPNRNMVWIINNIAGYYHTNPYATQQFVTYGSYPVSYVPQTAVYGATYSPYTTCPPVRYGRKGLE